MLLQQSYSPHCTKGIANTDRLGFYEYEWGCAKDASRRALDWWPTQIINYDSTW